MDIFIYFSPEKKYHGGAQRGHQKCEARAAGRPNKRLCHILSTPHSPGILLTPEDR